MALLIFAKRNASNHFEIILEHEPQRVTVGSIDAEITESLAWLLRDTETAANAVRFMTRIEMLDAFRNPQILEAECDIALRDVG